MIDNPVTDNNRPKNAYFDSFIPEWFDRSILRSYFSASVLSKHFGIGGYTAQSFIQKRLNQGRPVPSITQASNNIHGKVTLYKVIDVLICAKSDNLEITKTKEKETVDTTSFLNDRLSNLKREVAELEVRKRELSKDVSHLLGDFADISPALTQIKHSLLPKDVIIAKSKEDKGIACGIYFLIKDDEIVYIGQSVNIASRLSQHTNKDFDRMSFILCNKSELNILETLYILAYQPKLNGVMPCGNTGNTRLATPISLQNLISMFKKVE